MHPHEEVPSEALSRSGAELPLTPEQRERLARSIDADVEALLLDADAVERELQRTLESIDVDSDADLAVLASLEDELDRTVELKEWCRAKRAETAELQAQPR